MDGGAWRATVHGVTRVRHNSVTKPLHHHHYMPSIIRSLARSLPSRSLQVSMGRKSFLVSDKSLNGNCSYIWAEYIHLQVLHTHYCLPSDHQKQPYEAAWFFYFAENCQGPAPAGSRGYPQDEWRQGEKTSRTSLNRAKSARERGRKRERDQTGVQQGLAMLYFLL